MRARDNNLLGKLELFGISPAPRGVPRIEVTFEIDTNGILNISALEKGAGKTQKITKIKDKGRLSKENIERMVNEAGKYKEDDEAEAIRVTAKNNLESYAHSLKPSTSEDEFKSKIDAEDLSKLEAAIKETFDWLDGASFASTDGYSDKQKELEDVAKPILKKVYGAAGAPGAGGAPGGIPEEFPSAAGDAPGASEDGLTVEEVE